MAVPLSFRPTPTQSAWLTSRTRDGCLSKNALMRLALEHYISSCDTSSSLPRHPLPVVISADG